MNRAGPARSPRPPFLPDRIRLRPPHLLHPIKQLAGERCFPFLRRIALRPQATAERPLVAGKGVLGVTLSAVT